MVAEVLVGVEAAAWLRAWAGRSMEAKEGLLDNSARENSKLQLCSSASFFPPGFIHASVLAQNVNIHWFTSVLDTDTLT